jgi:hypothetical protein
MCVCGGGGVSEMREGEGGRMGGREGQEESGAGRRKRRLGSEERN